MHELNLRVVTFAIILLALVATGTASAAGVSRIVEYRSPLDDSLQAYGVYLPDGSPPGEAGYPAVLHGHGYGWSVSTRFSDFQREWADAHGWIMINLNARGPNFYEGVGNYESLRVVEDAIERFGVDRNRVYMTGGSMGGTGALRHGLRHPDVFAAVMGVDGWTDFRLWHKHWYARADAEELIEEFRRPLLQASSPLYWAERGELGATGHIVDGSDTTVWPQNGLRLYERLVALREAEQGAYDQRLIFNPELGHGRGTDYRAIYGFFLGRERVSSPESFTIQTTVLPHGELYWARIESFLLDGLGGSLQVRTEGDSVWASTKNLRALSLMLRAGPAGERDYVRVFVDGFPCYVGPPETLTLEAATDEAGIVVGWQVRRPQAGPRKTPEMSGPIGDAFMSPFAVAWSTAGPTDQVARHRLEAEQFADSWNDFFVRAPAVQAVPEDRLAPADITGRNIIIFGTLDSSRLLRQADAAHSFPVQVLDAGVIVRDAANGDRRYIGPQFGAMLCYPNPLNGFRTYLLVVNRRVFTKPEEKVPQLLGYDMEKLPWGYPDYVIFNNDQAQLPYVLNVNNKPAVDCYDAAYFVEADFFDDDWGTDSMHQLRRVRVQKPEEHRLVHVAELALEREPEVGASVLVTDGSGEPVYTARVTGRWWGEAEVVISALTDEEGRAHFPAPEGVSLERMSFEVIGLMATGGTWDRTADVARRLAPGALSPGQIDLLCLADRPAVAPTGELKVPLLVYNAGAQERRVRVTLLAPSGRTAPAERVVTIAAGGREHVEFSWWPEGRAAGEIALQAEARLLGGAVAASCTRSIGATVLPALGIPVVVGETKGADIAWGSPWKVTAKLSNVGCDGPVEVTAHCTLMEARRALVAKSATVTPGEVAVVEWGGDEILPRGEYTVRVTVEGAFASTATAKFAVH
jgi:pimeloyl-ACP methyl ester carboxylesterase